MAGEEGPAAMAGRLLALAALPGAGEVGTVAGRLLVVAAGATATAGASSKLNFAPRFCNSLVINSIWQKSVYWRWRQEEERMNLPPHW